MGQISISSPYSPLDQWPTPEDEGAANDNSTDDTTAVQSAITAAVAGSGILRLKGGSGYRITSGLTVSGPLRIIGDGTAVSSITTAANWGTNSPIVTVSGDDCRLDGFSILETSADPTNSANSGSNNCAIQVNGARCKIESVKTSGFGYGILARDTAADGSKDHLQISSSEMTNCYSWGIEIDGAQSVRINNTRTHTNGLDGIKVQQEHSRASDGLVIVGCESYSNGQRDTAAGGSDSTNGNGLDLFDGGYRATITDTRCHSNYGSGIVMKGTSPQPEQGQVQLLGVECIGNLSTSGGVSHGLEVGTSGATTASWLNVIGGSFSGNTGDGIFHGGGNGNRFVGVNCIANGRYGINASGGHDCTFDANCLGNQGIFGVVVGASNSASYESRRHVISGTISGNVDPALADNGDHRTAATEVYTQRGIQVYSDSADVTIRDAHIYNCLNYAIRNYGQNVQIRNCSFYDLPTIGVVSEAGSTVEIRHSTFNNALFALTFTTGNGTQPSPGDAITGATSGTASVMKSITVTGGSFAGGDAAGTIYLFESDGDYQIETLNAPSTTTMSVSALSATTMARIAATKAAFINNTLTLPAARGSIIGLYVDDVCTDFDERENSISANFSTQMTLEAGVVPASYYAANTITGNTDGTNALAQVGITSGDLPTGSRASGAVLLGWDASGDLAEFDAVVSGGRKDGLDDLGSQSGATYTVDFDAGSYDNKEFTAANNIALTLTATNSGRYILRIRTDGTNGRTITMASTTMVPAVTTLPVNGDANSLTVFNLEYDSTNDEWHW